MDPDGTLTLPVELRIGNTYVEILYAGDAPGFAGVMQINAKLPGIFTAPGTHPVTLTIGSAQSQPGVTITLR